MGPTNDAVIQEFIEQEVIAQQQVKAARDKLGTRVTRDESQVSVGGLLVLDQFLEILGQV
jgi:hypothetical protein